MTTPMRIRRIARPPGIRYAVAIVLGLVGTCVGFARLASPDSDTVLIGLGLVVFFRADYRGV